MRFTITIPAYKRMFLKEAVESCLCQTYTDFEVIILDDASPENLAEILDEFDDSRLRRYSNAVNVGAVDVVNNWNRCLELARGEYIICIGDDDTLLPDCLAQYNSMIERFPDVNVLHMRTSIIDENSKVIKTLEERPEWEDMDALIRGRMNGRPQFIGDFCFRTSSLRASGGYFYLPLAWASDAITAVRAAADGGIANCNVPGFLYRQNRFSISSSKNLKTKYEATLKEAKWYASLIDPQSENGKNIQAHYLKRCEISIYEALQEKFEILYWYRASVLAGISFPRYCFIAAKALLKSMLVK